MVIVIKREGAVNVSPASVKVLGDPPDWDWGSFGWGILTGGAATVILGGAALYFGWPYIRAGLTVIPVLQELVR